MRTQSSLMNRPLKGDLYTIPVQHDFEISTQAAFVGTTLLNHEWHKSFRRPSSRIFSTLQNNETLFYIISQK